MSRSTSSRSIFTTTPAMMSPSLKSFSDALHRGDELLGRVVLARRLRGGDDRGGVDRRLGGRRRFRCAGSSIASVSMLVSMSLMRWISFRHAGLTASRVGICDAARERPASRRKGRVRAGAPSTPEAGRRRWSVTFGCRFRPVGAESHVRPQVDVQLDRVLHPVPDQVDGLLGTVLPDLEDQLVVDREEHVAIEVRILPERPVDGDHPDLEDVGRAPLDRGVQRLAPAQVADAGVGGLELRDVPAPPEERLREALDRGPVHLMVQVLLDRRKPSKYASMNPWASSG